MTEALESIPDAESNAIGNIGTDSRAEGQPFFSIFKDPPFRKPSRKPFSAELLGCDPSLSSAQFYAHEKRFVKRKVDLLRK